MCSCLYTKRRAIYFASNKDLSYSAISRALASEGLSSTKSVSLLFQSIARKPGTGRASKITQQVKEVQMQAGDETTATELQRKLDANGINQSLSTILCCRRDLGHTMVQHIVTD